MIVLTAPTGQIGHQVLEQVLDHGEAIRLIARDPSRLSPQVRARVEVVQGSHGDSDVVNQAFAGADAVFWLVPPDPRAKSVEAAYCGLHAASLCSLKKPAGPTNSRRLGSRTWHGPRSESRTRYGLACNGRFDRKHGSEAPGADHALVHG